MKLTEAYAAATGSHKEHNLAPLFGVNQADRSSIAIQKDPALAGMGFIQDLKYYGDLVVQSINSAHFMTGELFHLDRITTPDEAPKAKKMLNQLKNCMIDGMNAGQNASRFLAQALLSCSSAQPFVNHTFTHIPAAIAAASIRCIGFVAAGAMGIAGGVLGITLGAVLKPLLSFSIRLVVDFPRISLIALGKVKNVAMIILSLVGMTLGLAVDSVRFSFGLLRAIFVLAGAVTAIESELERKEQAELLGANHKATEAYRDFRTAYKTLDLQLKQEVAGRSLAIQGSRLLISSVAALFDCKDPFYIDSKKPIAPTMVTAQLTYAQCFFGEEPNIVKAQHEDYISSVKATIDIARGGDTSHESAGAFLDSFRQARSSPRSNPSEGAFSSNSSLSSLGLDFDSSPAAAATSNSRERANSFLDAAPDRSSDNVSTRSIEE
ncbi:MAG: hypothetical protein K9M07_07725 [Simkaniaceae bacterium]|nr:hypothetical protein [Simkaniaceae bacterium]